jgi:hypothetical protein
VKLRDLDARFVYDARAGGSRLSYEESVDGMQGVMFQCPACAVGKEIVVDTERDVGKRSRRYVVGAHYVRVFFSNPRNVEVAPPDADHNPRWEMSGSTLDDLTLSPSINLDLPGQKDGCRWHGWVKNGDAT